MDEARPRRIVSGSRAIALLALVPLATCSHTDPRECAARGGARICLVGHRAGADLTVQGLEPGSPGTLTRLPEQVVLRAVARSNGTITVESLAPSADAPALRFEGTSGAGRLVALDLHWPSP